MSIFHNPGFLFRERSLHVVSESIEWGSENIDGNVLANKG